MAGQGSYTEPCHVQPVVAHWQCVTTLTLLGWRVFAIWIVGRVGALDGFTL